jgi:hypothetical protein
MKTLIPTCWSLSLLMLSIGCGGDSDSAIVQGTVTINGQLAPRGTVTFHPVAGGPVAVGAIHNNGTFALRIGQGNVRDPDQSKIPPGKYVATVVVNAPADRTTSVQESGGPPIGGPRLTAAKYASTDTSDLTFEVSPGRNVISLDLEGAEHDPVEESTPEPDSEGDSSATEAKNDESESP